ncbi:hypothetical protein LOK49_LG02G00742 [Camellia lanceoleosa]|uniref:Uncharacterized protein n=1 Tax=Camellia lanceoleosa TaxID=1840588 RepID=A0ACC0IKB5_9ERIC|nr:hypothetical protein LOK49_LG02G00742 [Camellia lanceoleosa]
MNFRGRGGRARGTSTTGRGRGRQATQPEPFISTFTPGESSADINLPSGTIQEWQPINTIPFSGINGEQYSFIDYTGSGLEFNLPENVQLSELSKCIIDNLWMSIKEKDIRKSVAVLNALCHYLAKEKK